MKKAVRLLTYIIALFLICCNTFAADSLSVGEDVKVNVEKNGSYLIRIDGVARCPEADRDGFMCISVRCVIDNHDVDTYGDGYLASYATGTNLLSVIDDEGFAGTYRSSAPFSFDGLYEVNAKIKLGEKKRSALLYFISPETNSVTVKVGEYQILFIRSGDEFLTEEEASQAAASGKGTGSGADTGSDSHDGKSSGKNAETNANNHPEPDTSSGSERTELASFKQEIEAMNTRLKALEKKETQLESEIQALKDEGGKVKNKAEAEVETEVKPKQNHPSISSSPADLTENEQLLQGAVSGYWHLFSFSEDPRSVRIVSMCVYEDSIIIDSIGKEFDGSYVRYLHQYFPDTDTLEALGRPDRVSDEYKAGSSKTIPIDSGDILDFSKSDRCRGYYISSNVFITDEEAEALLSGQKAEDTGSN